MQKAEAFGNGSTQALVPRLHLVLIIFVFFVFRAAWKSGKNQPADKQETHTQILRNGFPLQPAHAECKAYGDQAGSADDTDEQSALEGFVEYVVDYRADGAAKSAANRP